MVKLNQLSVCKKNSLRTLPWILVTLFFFYLTILQPLASASIADFDGLDYAIISIHLIHHIGSYWSPEFTATRYTHFFEHPPVGFWYFSIFYRIFGEDWYTDKIIALFDALWMITIILAFFRRDFPNTTRWLFWLPILLFLTNPPIYLYIMSNKLECIEVPLSLTILYWMSQCRYAEIRLSYLSFQSIIIGFICVIGFEINGLLFLYVWAAYLICAITSDHLSIKKAFLLTFLIIFSSLIFYTFLMWLIPQARLNNEMYFSTQLVPALFGQRTDYQYNMHSFNRLFVIGVYAKAIVPWLLVSVFAWLVLECRSYLTKSTPPTSHSNKGHLLFYIILSAATTLPLMASGKILGYYNLQTNAFLVLMLCCIITPPLQSFYESHQTRLRYLFEIIIALLFLYAFCWPTIFYFDVFKKYSMSRFSLLYTQVLKQYIPVNSIVSIAPNFLPHAITFMEPYLARFLNISLMAGGGCQYYIDSIYDFLPPPEGYHKINTDMLLITLYKRNQALSTCKPHEETVKEYHAYGYPLILFI
jgi:hypothetical protein